MQLFSAGYDRVDLEAARRAGVPVANNGGANSRAVAEHAITLMLAIYRKLVTQTYDGSNGRWRGNEPAPAMFELHGKTLGIIGLGHIGKRVARIALGGFDMNVQYTDVVRLPEDTRMRCACASGCSQNCCKPPNRHPARASEQSDAADDQHRGTGFDATPRAADQLQPRRGG